MTDCILGPDESGVFLTQILYETLVKIQFEKATDLKLLMVHCHINFQSGNPLELTLKRWDQFLNQSPLIEVIMPKICRYPNIETLIYLLATLNSQYTLLNTVICIFYHIQTEEFENTIYYEMQKLIMEINPNLSEWISKLEQYHSDYLIKSKGYSMKDVRYKNNASLRRELKDILNIATTNNKELEEECRMITKYMIENLKFVENPIHFVTLKTNVIKKNDLKKKILSLTYFDENLIEKLSKLETTSGYLNRSLHIFFKLINYRGKYLRHDGMWKEQLEEYISLTGPKFHNKAQNEDMKIEDPNYKKTLDYLTQLETHKQYDLNIDIGYTKLNMEHKNNQFDWINGEKIKELINEFLELKWKED